MVKWTDKKVMITGGAGFIGSHLTEALLEKNAHVVVLDNFCTGMKENIKPFIKDIKLIDGNITDYSSTLKASRNVDYIIHMAFPYGAVSPSVNSQFIEEGTIGTFNVLRAGLEASVKKIVYGSSVAVYGQQRYLPIDEKHPKTPFYPYGATKYYGELLCDTFSRGYGIKTASLRMFNIYGPRYAQRDHSALVTFINRAIKGEPILIYGDGRQMRDFTYISDVVDGVLRCLSKQDAQGSYNLGGGTGITIKDLAEKVRKIVNPEIEIRFAKESEYRKFKETLPYGVTKKTQKGYLDTRSFVSDNRKAARAFGYKPKIDIDKGIRKTLEWVKDVKMSR
jgi:nucleoside-diphosphate-sugar epimerase